MKAKLGTSTRLCILASVFVIGVVVAKKTIRHFFSKDTKTHIATVEKTKPSRFKEREAEHALTPPTEFYVGSDLLPDFHNKNPKHTDYQVSPQTILLTLIIEDGDLLADQCTNNIRDVVSPSQMREARLLAKQYDHILKDFRRQRSAVLEQVGVTIDDPEEKLALIRKNVFRLTLEARTEIYRKILTLEQRKLLPERFAAQRERARKESQQQAVRDFHRAIKK